MLTILALASLIAASVSPPASIDGLDILYTTDQAAGWCASLIKGHDDIAEHMHGNYIDVDVSSGIEDQGTYHYSATGASGPRVDYNVISPGDWTGGNYYTILYWTGATGGTYSGSNTTGECTWSGRFSIKE
jgi:hypothetical protein